MSAVSELVWRVHETGIEPGDLTLPFLEAANVDLAAIGYSNQVQPRELKSKRFSAYELDERGPEPMALLEFDQRYASGVPEYPNVQDVRFAIIGANAGAIAASYLVQRGFAPENMQMVDPMGRAAGIWNTGLAEGGFNNPRSLGFPPGHTLHLGDRNGNRMRKFLRGITDTHLADAPYIRDAAVNARRNNRSGTWEVETENGLTVEADYLVVGIGTPYPRRIDGKRLSSNLDRVADTVSDHRLTVERWQRTLTEDELYSSRPIVLIGLGNSTGTMLKQIHAFEDRTGRSVPYLVVTDLPGMAVRNPRKNWRNHDSVFRKPKVGYLTGYSGDLPEDADAYFRALDEGRIISGVTKVNFDSKTDMLHIGSTEYNVSPAETPRVFALLGYERDDHLFTSIGARVLRGLRGNVEGPYIRGEDGAVWTKGDGYASNAFAIGAAAATRENPTAAVIPAVFAAAPRLTLTAATREFARQRSNPALLQRIATLLQAR